MNPYPKTRTLTAGLVVLAMIVVPTAFAAGKPDDEHRYLGTGAAADVRSPDRIFAGQYGISRALPSHYEQAGVELVRQSGTPRAMPSDYAAGGFAVPGRRDIVADFRSADTRDAVIPPVSSVFAAAPGTGFDWSDAGIGAGAASALLLAALAVWALAARRRSDPPSGVGASVVSH